MAEPSADPTQFKEAVDAFRDRVPMDEDAFDALTASEKALAFKVSGVAQAGLVQQVHDGIESAIANGTTLEDFKAEFGPKLTEAWGGENPYRVETIFRVGTMQAYNAGRHEIFSAPAVKEARPIFRWDTANDDRVSDECEELEGTTLAQDDPFWDNHWPPFHPNCRCVVTALSQEEADDDGGMDDEGPDVEADDGFGAEPSGDGRDWTPDLESFDPDVRAILEDRLASAEDDE